MNGIAADCLACAELVEPFGIDQLVAGLAFAAVALVPGALVHRILRRRGR